MIQQITAKNNLELLHITNVNTADDRLRRERQQDGDRVEKILGSGFLYLF